MPRFVVLAHDWPCPHWDFLVEAGPVLRAWRLLELPLAGAPVRAESNADHRLRYLDYEGPVSGNRGTVTRTDAGTCDWLEDGDARVRIQLRGARFAGIAELRRDDTGWTFALAGG